MSENLVLAYCLVKGRNWFSAAGGRLGSMICGIFVTGVELYGEPQYQTQRF